MLAKKAKEDLADEMDFKRRLGLLLAGTVLRTSILVSAPGITKMTLSNFSSK